MRWIGLVIGIIALAAGIIWTLQGFNVLRGSVMSGQTMWQIIGPIVALIGAILVIFTARGRAAAS
jgi:hypothetical protein